jgi:hypothetical protein
VWKIADKAIVTLLLDRNLDRAADGWATTALASERSREVRVPANEPAAGEFGRRSLCTHVTQEHEGRVVCVVRGVHSCEEATIREHSWPRVLSANPPRQCVPSMKHLELHDALRWD